jgi:membrane-anchored mycosin MYCP
VLTYRLISPRVRAVLTLTASALGAAEAIVISPAIHAVPTVQDCSYAHSNQSPVDDTTDPPAQRRLRPDTVWPLTRGAGVVVAVVDTGVQPGNLLADDVLPGTDVVNGGAGAADCDGHGTMVAGLIAGHAAVGDTRTRFSGIAPDSHIYPVIESERGGQNTDPDAVKHLAAAIRAAADAPGVRVINVSVTAETGEQDLCGAVTEAAKKGALVVAAAGNQGSTGSTEQPQYPAACPGVLAVGAVDGNGKVLGFSEKQPYVSVVAPGDQIVGPGLKPANLILNNEQGTSFAAAYVSGTAALVRAYHPDWSAARVKHQIEATADRLATTTQPDTTDGYGWGMVDPYQAVTRILADSDQGSVALPAARGKPLTPPAAAAPNTAGHATNALFTALVAGLVAIVACGVGATVRIGRRRHGQ